MIGIEIDKRPKLHNRFVRYGERCVFELVNLNADGTANNEVLVNVEIKIYDYGRTLISSPLLSFNFSSGISQTGNVITCNIDVTGLARNDYDWAINYIRATGSKCVAQGTFNVSVNARNYN
jgi:hypothetical protein